MTLHANIDYLPIVVGTARLGNARASHSKDLKRALHNHRLENVLGDDLVSMTLLFLHTEVRLKAYPYSNKTNDEITKCLWDMITIGYYAYDFL